MMSQERSCSKFDNVKRKLCRFRREYFCIRSSQRCVDGTVVGRGRSDIGDDAAGPPSSLPLSGWSVRQRGGGHDGERPATTHGGRLRSDGDGCVPYRRSLQSRCVSIPESPDEEEEDDAASAATTPVSTDCAPATRESGPASSAPVNRGELNEDRDVADYDQFVRGLLQSTTGVTALTRPPMLPGGDVPAGTVHCSARWYVGGTTSTTPCSVGRRSTEPLVGRFPGAKLIRTLRKTFSVAVVGKSDDAQEPSTRTGRPSTSSFDSRTSYADDFESMLLTHRLDEDHHVISDWRRLVVSSRETVT